MKQMSDQTGQLLGGPPRKDLKDEKIFSDEQSEGMEKLQQMDRDKVKRMEKREAELKDMVEKEKKSVEDYESRRKELQEEVLHDNLAISPWRTHCVVIVSLFLTQSLSQRMNESMNRISE